jgi:hypothetical protein
MSKNTIIAYLYILISIALIVTGVIILILGYRLSIPLKLITALALVSITYNLGSVLGQAELLRELNEEEFDDDDDEIE